MFSTPFTCSSMGVATGFWETVSGVGAGVGGGDGDGGRGDLGVLGDREAGDGEGARR